MRWWCPRAAMPTRARSWPIRSACNAMLGTYTNFVNLLDLAADHGAGRPADVARPPASLTLIGPAWSDDRLVGTVGAVP